ncbi:SHOCT domain-containing protein [Streptomyces poonensis]|uniref:SHOCT domain-containing protein n=1 Tax=Streptomyces poonensis TaxID=68255 RepID=A0A918PS60_9ACTN|nr:SHOCT domain-containing protein [Streptomyces poonensis]GGZ19628.1 hypothetical protein GCM10010365_44790 [Streptomyces poonensis]
MMYWNGNNMSGWGWFAMSLGTVLFWALLIAAAVVLFRALNRGHADTHTGVTPSTPEHVLAERFARGDIDEEEYRRRLDVLRKGP